jgi:hypothetical protein
LCRRLLRLRRCGRRKTARAQRRCGSAMDKQLATIQGHGNPPFQVPLDRAQVEARKRFLRADFSKIGVSVHVVPAVRQAGRDQGLTGHDVGMVDRPMTQPGLRGALEHKHC